MNRVSQNTKMTFVNEVPVFEQQDSPLQVQDDLWLTITEGMYAPYCQSRDDTLMFADQQNEKFAMTKDMQLQTGDIVQFRVSGGCS